jgi:hypothetical protein
MAATSSILASVHAVETVMLQVCENPLCTVQFPQSGLKIEPRRYCSAQCRQQASLIRRAANLLKVLSDVEVLNVVRKR